MSQKSVKWVEKGFFGVCIDAFLIKMKFMPQITVNLCCVFLFAIIVHFLGFYEGTDSSISAGDTICESTCRLAVRFRLEVDFVRNACISNRISVGFMGAWVGVTFGF